MKYVKLKNLLKEESGVPTDKSVAPAAPSSTAPNQDAPEPAAAPAAGTGADKTFIDFEGAMKTVDAQKAKIIAKYEGLLTSKFGGKKVKFVASKAQYFQPASEYTSMVDSVKISQHFDKSKGSVVYDFIFKKGDTNYFVKDYNNIQVLSADVPEPEKPQAEPKPEAPKPETAQNPEPVQKAPAEVPVPSKEKQNQGV